MLRLVSLSGYERLDGAVVHAPGMEEPAAKLRRRLLKTNAEALSTLPGVELLADALGPVGRGSGTDRSFRRDYA